ncbi:MAG: AsmA family protein [Cucumibacter sp.]
MLNRLFIVVGSLAIVAILAAFIVPGYYDWNPYRARLEQIAEEALGTPITIRGDLKLTILPQPRMTLNDVLVGPPGAPIAEIARIEAEFALMEFVRDRYNVANLVLEAPKIAFRIDSDGRFTAPFDLAREVSTTNVAIRNARVTGATVSLTDERTGEVYVADSVEAGLKLTALRGPFSVQATGNFEGAPYQLRVSTSDPNENGDIRLSAHLRPLEGRFTVSAEGLLTLADGRPRFAGTGTWQYQPEPSDDVRTVSGAAVLDATVEADPERLLLTNFTYLPDETRAGTRLSGAAEIRLGADPQFDAVISGGVVSLFEPGDVREEAIERPYAILQLLDELPAPPVTGLPGRIGLDIAELDLRGLSLREVRLDARTDGSDWEIEELTGRLPGETSLSLAGRSSGEAGAANFEGTVTLESRRLDALARGWREETENNPLFNTTGRLTAQVAIEEGGMALTHGEAEIEGNAVAFSAQLVRRPSPSIEIEASLGALDQLASAQLAALFPETLGSPAFAVSFPQGSAKLAAEGLVYRGEALRGVDLSASWTPEGIEFEHFAASETGGSSLEASGRVAGTLAEPHLTGTAEIALTRGARIEEFWALLPAPALAPPIATGLRASLPLQLSLTLDDQEGTSQRLALTGVSGLARVAGEATFGNGIIAALAGTIEATLDIQAPDRTALATALGVSASIAAGLVIGEPASLSVRASGTLAGSVETDLEFVAGDERLAYDGMLVVSNPSAISGQGRIDVRISDFAGYADVLGLEGLSLPAVLGVADIRFEGAASASATRIDAVIGGQRIAGELSLARSGGAFDYAGALRTDRVELAALGSFLGGAASMVPGDGVWPIGPIAVGEGARSSRGRIAVEAERLRHDGLDLLSGVRFDFAWDGSETRIRELTGALGEGEVTVDARLCCASAVPDKQLTARFSIDGVELELLLPEVLAGRLGGSVEASGQVSGSGASFADIAQTLGGEGGFAVDALTVEGFSSGVFEAIARIDNVIELEPAELTNAVATALAMGSFEAPRIEGLFSVAAGAARVTNLAAEAGGVRLLGDGALDLGDFRLDSAWSLTPAIPVGGNGLITESTGRVTALVEGPLSGPESRLDVAQMVDALKVRALEIEVARLEQLRAEDEARIRAASAEAQRQLAMRFIGEAIAAREAAAREAVRVHLIGSQQRYRARLRPEA